MDLRYPIGRFDWAQSVSPSARPELIATIAAAPSRFRQAASGLDDSQLDTPYRPGGWTVRQVVHHVADSHINSYCRFRLALTEDEPAVKGYDEGKWAQLHDARSLPVEPSLSILANLHARWVDLLESMTDADYSRRFQHSQHGALRLDTNLALYAWHSRHHEAHITSLRERMEWK